MAGTPEMLLAGNEDGKILLPTEQRVKVEQ